MKLLLLLKKLCSLMTQLLESQKLSETHERCVHHMSLHAPAEFMIFLHQLPAFLDEHPKVMSSRLPHLLLDVRVLIFIFYCCGVDRTFSPQLPLVPVSTVVRYDVACAELLARENKELLSPSMCFQKPECDCTFPAHRTDAHIHSHTISIGGNHDTARNKAVEPRRNPRQL